MPRQKKFSIHLHFDLEDWGVNDAKQTVENIITRAGLYGAHIYMQHHQTGATYRKIHRKKWIKDKG